MDTWTLTCGYEVLRSSGIRSAGRALDRAPGSVVSALARLEASLATTLVQTSDGHLTVTLEGHRKLPELREANDVIADIQDIVRRVRGEAGAMRNWSVGLAPLFRFVHVARAGSIRRAARDLGLGQPQLSRQIAALERDIGAALLTRTTEGALLTAVGEELLPFFERLEDIWKRLAQGAGGLFVRNEATCRLGSIMPLSYQSSTARRLAHLAAAWLHTQPRTPLFISNATADELLAGLRGGRYDLILFDTDTVPAEFEFEVIGRSPVALVGSTDFFRRNGRDIADLVRNHPVSVPSTKSGLRQKFSELLKKIVPDDEAHSLRLVDIDSLPIIIDLILRYNFLAVLPTSSFAGMSEPLDGILLGDTCDVNFTLVWLPNARSRKNARLALDLLRA